MIQYSNTSAQHQQFTYTTAVAHVTMVTCMISGHGQIQNDSKFKYERTTLAIHECYGNSKLIQAHLVYVCYGVATISRLLEIIGLFCKRAL